MRSLAAICALTALCPLAGCGTDTTGSSAEPTVGSVAETPASTLVLGEFRPDEDGVTYVPSVGRRGAFFVADETGALLALDATSPVLGCKVVEVDASLRSEFGIGSDVAFFDMCHGAEFARSGARLDADDCPGLRQLGGVGVVDGQVIVQIGTRSAPSERSPTRGAESCGAESAVGR